MDHIAIEIATYDGSKKDFVYPVRQRFPDTAKGLTLAIIAAERMMKIEAHHIAFSEIGIKFMSDEKNGEPMGDQTFFDLVTRHRAGSSIVGNCLEIINQRVEGGARPRRAA